MVNPWGYQYENYLHFSIREGSTVVSIGNEPEPSLEQTEHCSRVLVDESGKASLHKNHGVGEGRLALRFIVAAVEHIELRYNQKLSFTMASHAIDQMIAKSQSDENDYAYDEWVENEREGSFGFVLNSDGTTVKPKPKRS